MYMLGLACVLLNPYPTLFSERRRGILRLHQRAVLTLERPPDPWPRRDRSPPPGLMLSRRNSNVKRRPGGRFLRSESPGAGKGLWASAHTRFNPSFVASTALWSQPFHKIWGGIRGLTPDCTPDSPGVLTPTPDPFLDGIQLCQLQPHSAPPQRRRNVCHAALVARRSPNRSLAPQWRGCSQEARRAPASTRCTPHLAHSLSTLHGSILALVWPCAPSTTSADLLPR